VAMLLIHFRQILLFIRKEYEKFAMYDEPDLVLLFHICHQAPLQCTFGSDQTPPFIDKAELKPKITHFEVLKNG
jgi:hypothetical protein